MTYLWTSTAEIIVKLKKKFCAASIFRLTKCDPPYDFDAKGDSTLTTYLLYQKKLVLARLMCVQKHTSLANCFVLWDTLETIERDHSNNVV